MRPLDIVTADGGLVGMIQVVTADQKASIHWFNAAYEKTAWWTLGEKNLQVIGNIAESLTHAMIGSCRGVNPYEAKP